MITVDDCRLSGNGAGISFNQATNIEITNSEILNTQYNAITIIDGTSDTIWIESNRILNATNGIYCQDSDWWTIINNTIMYCNSYGIFADWTGPSPDHLNITLNNIENNYNAIRINYGILCSITNNTIRWNTGTGIYLGDSVLAYVYYNILAVNLEDNGYDSMAGFWDDSVDTGNWWDDYTPPPPYDVDGNTQDRYPRQYLPTKPIISQPQDIYYAEGSTDNVVTWLVLDDSLNNWAATIDGNTWASDAWNFHNITVNIDGLPYGLHTIVVTVYDIHMNEVSDSVLIHVYDGTVPVISNTPNTEAFVTGSGQTLTWTVSDLHPGTYTLYVDDEVFATGSWTNGELEVNIDGLTEGIRHLRMVIFDIDGNTASDPVDVLVILDEVDPTINSPDDITYTEGTTGNNIIWTPEDLHPGTYLVEYNDSVLLENQWAGSRIVLNVDGLAPGTHRFGITVSDKSGNAVEDAVTVRVLPIVAEIITPPPADLSGLLLVAAVAGIAVVAVVVIYLLYQKKKAT